MDTFLELINAVQDDITVGSESTLFSEALIKRYINRAYRGKVAALFRWPELEDAKKTSTEASKEYYNYPDTWQPDSIWKLKVDGEDYGDPLVYKDYLYEREESFPSGLTKAWSSQWRRYFIYPVPTTNGNNNICIWGQKVATALSSNTDTTIFSYSMPECNEAIVLETVAMLRAKGEDRGDFMSLEAKQLATNAFAKVRQNQAKYEKTQPYFEVPDFFARGRTTSKTRIGNF